MKPFAAWLVLVSIGTLSVTRCATADASPNRRLILHGVDCSIQTEQICPDAQPVFDEAISILADEQGAVVVQLAVAGAASSEPAGTLSESAAQAVRSYLAASGGAPQVCSLEATLNCALPPRLELQLSRLSE